MNEVELVLVKEGLQLADDALGHLMQVHNPHISHIANLLHAAITFGEMVINASSETKPDGQN